ncbi:MAG: DUF669 domain-containing protein [Candidatus Pacearchaeota archaeon]
MGLNLKDTQGGGTFTEIPSGRYNVRVDQVVVTQTQDKSSDMLKLTYKVTDGEHEKRNIFDQAVVTVKSLWKLKSLLTAVGSPLADSSNAELDEIADALKNKEMSVYAEITKNEDGKARFQCSGWQPVSKPVAKPPVKKVSILN